MSGARAWLQARDARGRAALEETGRTSAVLAAARAQGGFLTSAMVAELARTEGGRLTSLLVRCGGCRFVAPAQDVAKIIAALEAAGEYVRDVSLPAGSAVRP